MPSKRKTKKREDKLFQEGWFQISEDMWKDPYEKLPKPKLLADADFPVPLVKKIRAAKINIKTAQELKLNRLGDEDLLPQAAKVGRLLITMDDDFWSEKKFPLHRSEGVIIVASGSAFERSDGFYTLVEFLRAFGGRWVSMKIKASAAKLVLKLKSFNGKTTQYEMKVFRGIGAFAREFEKELALVD